MKHLPENNTGKKNLCFTQDNEGKITEDDSSSATQIDKSGLTASGTPPAHSHKKSCFIRVSNALAANGPYNVSAGQHTKELRHYPFMGLKLPATFAKIPT